MGQMIRRPIEEDQPAPLAGFHQTEPILASEHPVRDPQAPTFELPGPFAL
jgi:hypothetical protein